MEPSFPAKEILQLCQVNKTNAWGDGTRVAIVDFTQPRNPAQCCSEKPRFAVGRGTVVSLPPPLPLGPTDSQAQPCSPFCHSFLFHHSLSYCSSFLQILKHSAFFPVLGRHWALAGNILFFFFFSENPVDENLMRGGKEGTVLLTTLSF